MVSAAPSTPCARSVSTWWWGSFSEFCKDASALERDRRDSKRSLTIVGWSYVLGSARAISTATRYLRRASRRFARLSDSCSDSAGICQGKRLGNDEVEQENHLHGDEHREERVVGVEQGKGQVGRH